MNGFELCEKIFSIDINVKVCFMSSGEINREALREITPTRQEGCDDYYATTVMTATRHVVNFINYATIRKQGLGK